MIGAHVLRACGRRDARRPDRRGRDRLLGDPGHRVRRGSGQRVLRVPRKRALCARSSRRSSSRRRLGRHRARGGGDSRRAARRGRALRDGARAPVRRPRFLLRRFERAAAPHANAVPGGARGRHRPASHEARRGLPLPLEPPVPAHDGLSLRARELRRAGRAARDRRHRKGGRADGRRRSACSSRRGAARCCSDRSSRRSSDDGCPSRSILLLELWTWTGCAALPRLAERLRADGEHRPDRASRSRRPTRSCAATSSR